MGKTDGKIGILIATGLYPPEAGGPATYSKILMEELPRRGFAVDVLPFSEVRSLPKIARHLVYFAKCLWRARDADIIYAQDPVSVGFPAMLAARVLRKKFLLKIVGDYAWEQHQVAGAPFISLDEFQNKKFDWLTELRRKIERLAANAADRIVTPSEYLKKIVVMWGIAPAKIAVVYNSFELSDVRRPTKEGMGRKIIFSAGRLVPWKGFEALIEIIPEILKEAPEAELLIAGDGPEMNNLKFKIKNLKLEHRVRLLGGLSRADVWKYLTNSDVFVLNTGYEGLSHVLLEALAAGVPTLTTNVGGNPEIIKDGENGLLVGYNDRPALIDAIVRLLTDENLRAKLIQGAAGEYSTARFSKEKMMNGLIAVLKSLTI